MSGAVAAEIQKRIQSSLAPSYIKLENESYKHRGPKDAESHFHLVVVSDKFVGLNRVKRQQMVFGFLTDIMKNSVHALALFTYTPEEWTAVEKAPESPDCAHKR